MGESAWAFVCFLCIADPVWGAGDSPDWGVSGSWKPLLQQQPVPMVLESSLDPVSSSR